VRPCYRALAAIKRTREDYFDERAGSSNSGENEKVWSRLWKVDVPSKVRIFLWRLAKHSLPTSDVRHRRNMVASPACSI
jgi:hypothetical protein